VTNQRQRITDSILDSSYYSKKDFQLKELLPLGLRLPRENDFDRETRDGRQVCRKGRNQAEDPGASMQGNGDSREKERVPRLCRGGFAVVMNAVEAIIGSTLASFLAIESSGNPPPLTMNLSLRLAFGGLPKIHHSSPSSVAL
jgi:hypothetical protein